MDEPGTRVATLRIDAGREGPTGSGNGGWSAARLVAVVGQPATVAIRAPIPLDVELDVVATDAGWSVVDPSDADRTSVMTAARWTPDYADTEPVSIEDARAARGRFEHAHDHPAPTCFSCGVHAGSMGVMAGPLGHGRYATDWTVPAWAASADGVVDEAALWAAIDCTAAWYVNAGPSERRAFTVQFAAEVTAPLEPEATYALVGSAGDWGDAWDGRKRHAASAAFDRHGRCVARSRSFWVAAELPAP